MLVVLFPYELPQVGAQLGLATEVDGREAFGFRLGGSQPKSVGEVGNTKTSEFPPGRLADLGSLIGCGQEPQVVGGHLAPALTGGALAVEAQASRIWTPPGHGQLPGSPASGADGIPTKVPQEILVEDGYAQSVRLLNHKESVLPAEPVRLSEPGPGPRVIHVFPQEAVDVPPASTVGSVTGRASGALQIIE